MPPVSRSLRLVFRAAGFMATRVLSRSPGVWMSRLLKWTWKPETPARVPAGARISAGKSGKVAMSLPRMAEALVNWVPANCMPSPESPAKRMVTESSSCTGARRWPGAGPAGGRETVMKSSTVPSGPFAFVLHGAGIRGLVINGPGKVFDQVVDDPLDGEDAHGAPGFVHHGQVAVAALFHALDGGADRFFGVDDHGVGGHAGGDGQGQGLAGGQDPLHQVALGKKADHPGPLADQDAADLLAPHQGNGVRHRLGGADLARRGREQPRHAVDLQVPGQVHNGGLTACGGRTGGRGGSRGEPLSRAATP